MADEEPRATAAAIYLLVRYPPIQSGRDVVGGWELEAWRRGDCSWAIELADFGAYYWADSELAQIVATRSLSAQLVTVATWLPCGSGHAPMFLARPSIGSPVSRRPVISRRRTAGRPSADHTTTRRFDADRFGSVQ